MKRKSRTLTHNGETRTVAEWADIIGVTYMALSRRLDKLPVETALTMPHGGRRKHAQAAVKTRAVQTAIAKPCRLTRQYKQPYVTLPIGTEGTLIEETHGQCLVEISNPHFVQYFPFWMIEVIQ